MSQESQIIVGRESNKLALNFPEETFYDAKRLFGKKINDDKIMEL